jgi:hypothetical protein
MSAALWAVLAAVWEAAGGYIVSAIGGAAALFFVTRRSTAQAKKSQQAEKGGEETALLAKQLGEAAETTATIDSAKRGVNAQSDDSLRDVATDRWVRK